MPPFADPPAHVLHVPVAAGVDLAVDVWDGAESPAFLLVHGLASNARLWDGVAVRLHAAGHAVAAVDLRGHGRSATPSTGYDHPTIAADLAAVVGHLSRGPVVAVGQSWGGNVVLELAARHRAAVVGVAAVDGGTIDLPARFADLPSAVHALRPPPLAGTPVADLRRRLRAAHPDWTGDAIAAALANFAVDADGRASPRLSLDAHLQIIEALWHSPPSRLYARVGVGVLLLPVRGGAPGWAKGQAEGVAAALASLPRARVTWLEGDHDVHAQRPAVVADALLDAVADGLFDPP